MSTNTTAAIVGDLSLDMQDGTTLTARSDVGLAREWARHALGERWGSLTRGEQAQHVEEALRELRRTYQENE